jgi:S1-C subfamily serine protease
VLALVLVPVLAAGLGLQTWRLLEVSSQLDRADQRLSDLVQGQEYGGERLDALEDRASELERRAGEAFNSEEIAAAVVPSVFMVVAGDFTGTAFAVGPAADDGGTNLFTNHHVVQPVWDSGGREVVLERTNQRYPAEIVAVDEEGDVAWLRTDTSFRGLRAGTGEVRSGQPIIAVGAPLGLTDVVTTGVVSSPSQELPDGSGPWIQFDAAVNPGNSGGPVVNSDQQVVGIATRKGNDAEALGFAVPISIACELFEIC